MILRNFDDSITPSAESTQVLALSPSSSKSATMPKATPEPETSSSVASSTLTPTSILASATSAPSTQGRILSAGLTIAILFTAVVAILLLSALISYWYHRTFVCPPRVTCSCDWTTRFLRFFSSSAHPNLKSAANCRLHKMKERQRTQRFVKPMEQGQGQGGQGDEEGIGQREEQVLEKEKDKQRQKQGDIEQIELTPESTQFPMTKQTQHLDQIEEIEAGQKVIEVQSAQEAQIAPNPSDQQITKTKQVRIAEDVGTYTTSPNRESDTRPRRPRITIPH